MKHMRIVIVGVILLLIFGSFVFLFSKDESQPQNNPSNSSASTPSNNTGSETPNNTTSGVYLDYQESALASTDGTILLFFHAPWCPQCRELDSSIMSSSIPEDVTIFKVDYDNNQQLRQKYGVLRQTTVVKVSQSGELIEKYDAYSEPTFERVKQELLQ